MSTTALILIGVAAAAILGALVGRLLSTLFPASPKTKRHIITLVVAIVAFIIIAASPAIITQLAEQELSILDEGNLPNSFLIAESNQDFFSVGDNLVVYGEGVRNEEQPIGLLRIVAKNPNNLTVQSVLVHPQIPIKARMRVDRDVEDLATSELVPADNEFIGYFLRNDLEEGLIRLRPDNSLTENDTLEAFEALLVDGAVIDYLPYKEPIYLKVTSMGTQNEVARVELLSGQWPEVGTVVSVLITPADLDLPLATSTDTNSPPAAPPLDPEFTLTCADNSQVPIQSNTKDTLSQGKVVIIGTNLAVADWGTSEEGALKKYGEGNEFSYAPTKPGLHTIDFTFNLGGKEIVRTLHFNIVSENVGLCQP